MKRSTPQIQHYVAERRVYIMVTLNLVLCSEELHHIPLLNNFIMWQDECFNYPHRAINMSK